jgi:hypothetical protein
MPEPTVRELLLADLDELVPAIQRSLDAVQAITDQLELDRAPACRIAVSVTRAAIDEIQLPAHARPISEGGR